MGRGRMAGLLCLLGLGAAGAWAQGMYYREVAKDGRLYVFNRAQRYPDWEASGELPGAITLEAYGVAGETVVADSEEAIHLYNFRHGRPGDPRPQPKATPGPGVSWRDGTTTILVPDMAQVRISNRVQVRYTHELPDETVQLPGTAAAGRRQGLLPHPPGEAQDRRVVLQDLAPIRAPGELAGGLRHQRRGAPGGRRRQLGSNPRQAQAHGEVRPVQGPLRPAAAHLGQQPAARGPLAGVRHVRPRARDRRPALGPRCGGTTWSGGLEPSTATASPAPPTTTTRSSTTPGSPGSPTGSTRWPARWAPPGRSSLSRTSSPRTSPSGHWPRASKGTTCTAPPPRWT